MFFERSTNCQPLATPPAGAKNIIVSIPFIEFRAFYRMILSVVTIEYHYRIQKRLPFLLHSILKSQEYCSPHYGFRHRYISDILSVFIPQGSSINHPFSGFHQYGVTPFAFRVFRLYHVNPIVRIAPVDINSPLWKRDRRPIPAMLGLIEKFFQFPLHQATHSSPTTNSPNLRSEG